MRDRLSADLYQRLPGHFRIRDAEEGRPLEALMGILGDELQILERDLDQLYDNWFVETCEPWALPYIAALIGARPMREIGEDRAGQLRAYVANILQYRQAKGTAAVVEQVARDVSGWPVVAVEFFQRLAASQHMNHIRPDAPAFLDIRNSARARTSRSPFSTLPHAAAAGQPEGWTGRYNIPHLGVFVWRNSAAPLWPVETAVNGYLGGAMPRRDGSDAGLLRFDPFGRDLPLVNRPAADLSIAARMTERTVPAALRRDQVFDALNAGRETGVTPGRWFEDEPPFRVRLDGAEVPAGKLFCCDLSKTEAGAFRRPAQAGEVLVDPVLGRLSLHATDETKPVETGFAQAAHFDIGGGAYDRRESVEKWLPELVIEGEDAPFQIGVTQRAEEITDDELQGGPVVGSIREAVHRWNQFQAGSPGARGIIVVMDSASYDEALNAQRRILLAPGAKLAIVAAAWPVIESADGTKRRSPGQLSPMHRRPLLTGPVMIDAADAGEDEGGTLILDGLALGDKVEARAGGDLGHLWVLNCTVGASGALLDKAIVSTADNARMRLTLDRSIAAKIDLPLATGALTISRSILGEDVAADGGGTGNATLVARTPRMDAEISGCTILGRVTCRSIRAENSLLTGDVTVAHKQQGCVRFSWTTPGSVLPRRYKCVPSAADNPIPRPIFVSTRFQDPGFALLRLSTPTSILEGAEDGMEMGVGFANRDPARRANIADAIQEFSPFGLTPGVIFVT